MYPRWRHVVFVLLPWAASAAVPNRYIVEMDGDPVAVQVARAPRSGGIRGVMARQRRVQIREAQRPVRARLEAAEAQVLDSVDTVANAFIVNIPDEKAAALRSIPGVLRVHRVRTFKPLLDHALPLHHVPEAWNLVGIDKAGAGMKIAIIDTGIDMDHAGFNDPSLPIPDGFPRANTESDLAFTNHKVIVARSYPSLFGSRDPDTSPRDHVGHGTATAMAAAGVSNAGPLAVISGVAPKAYLGSYKVFGTPGYNDGATDAAILKAIDDAVADGMDVISMSLGTLEATRIEQDIEVAALQNAAALGVIVVVAAGNDGPDPFTIGSPGTAPSAITVGASKNDRTFAASVTVDGADPALAIPGSGANSATPITAPLAWVGAIDESGLACSTLQAGSLKGRIAFILRGQCTFEVKLNNAQSAGAVGALVYTVETDPDPFTMGVGAATLPGSMVSYSAGTDILQRLTRNPSLTATLSFTLGPVWTSADGLVAFSSQGPNVDLNVKPDMAAVGVNFYTAAQKLDSQGGLYDPSGYAVTQGTSFSTPLIAGAAALLKGARPGLSVDQYRSLLINSTGATSGTLPQQGAGILNLNAALLSAAAASPAIVSFQVGNGDPNVSRNLNISNVGTASTAFQLTVVAIGGGPLPQLSTDSVSLDPGNNADIALNLSASNLAPGQYQGFIRVTDTNSNVESRVPYWYAVRSETPKNITIIDAITTGRSNQSLRNAVLFRLTDASGIPMPDFQPKVIVVSGSGVPGTVTSIDDELPGVFSLTIRLGRGTNVVRIQAGDTTKDVSITGR